LHTEVTPRKVTIMKPHPEDVPEQPRDKAVSSEVQLRPPFWLVVPAALTALVLASSWISGRGSWPDWVYALLVMGSLALIVATVVQRWCARTKRP
jgi:hypothetical protein